MPEINIQIGGRDFAVACQPGEEPYLHAAARIVPGPPTNAAPPAETSGVETDGPRRDQGVQIGSGSVRVVRADTCTHFCTRRTASAAAGR